MSADNPCCEWEAELVCLRTEVARITALVAETHESLVRYGQHLKSCGVVIGTHTTIKPYGSGLYGPAVKWTSRPCDCGWDAAHAALASADQGFLP